MARADGFEGMLPNPAASAEAMFQLGLHYCLGRGVDVDLVAAHKWFNIAAMRGLEVAREYRAEICRDMTPQQIAQAQREARDFVTATQH